MVRFLIKYFSKNMCGWSVFYIFLSSVFNFFCCWGVDVFLTPAELSLFCSGDIVTRDVSSLGIKSRISYDVADFNSMRSHFEMKGSDYGLYEVQVEIAGLGNTFLKCKRTDKGEIKYNSWLRMQDSNGEKVDVTLQITLDTIYLVWWKSWSEILFDVEFSTWSLYFLKFGIRDVNCEKFGVFFLKLVCRVSGTKQNYKWFWVQWLSKVFFPQFHGMYLWQEFSIVFFETRWLC